MNSLNIDLLEEKLSSESRNISSALLGSIRSFVENGKEIELAQINPNRLADRIGEDRLATLKAFLYLTKSGVFDMEWAVHCPHCSGVNQVAVSLGEIKHEGLCNGCLTGFEASFCQNTEIRFKINPAIVKLGDISDFDLMVASYETEPGINLEIEPNGEHFLEIDVSPGNWVLTNLADRKVRFIPVSAETTSEAQEIRLEYADNTPQHYSSGPIKSGKLSLLVSNQTAGSVEFHLAKLKNPEWASASVVSSLQEFRDLFSKEMLSGNETFAIRNLTFIFTDIKSSTELYEKLGDSKAFYLVKEHFKIMEVIVKKYNGGIVKTIGDAIMAVFSEPSSALACSIEMIEAFDRFNVEGGTRDKIIIKVGIHSGPCIAVTLNERLDYFGTTVNTAARVQGLSDGRDVMLSDRFFIESRAEKFLAGKNWKIENFVTSLRGLSEKFKIHKLVGIS